MKSAHRSVSRDGLTNKTPLAVWLALGKVLLALGLIFFTFVAMLGGNPLHEYVFTIILTTWLSIGLTTMRNLVGLAFGTGSHQVPGPEMMRPLDLLHLLMPSMSLDSVWRDRSTFRVSC